ncbi:MAG: hypothetical protein NTY35_04870 [Planctomycetota bacterium]|nr:hypothetical protein [Planctomycetota bacterium]
MANMRSGTMLRGLLLVVVGLAGACAAKPPEPILVLENPTTHERANFYREIPFKVPADYDEAKHIASWRAEQERKGYTVQVKP